MAAVLLRSQWSEVHANFTELGVPSPEAVQHHTGGAGPGDDLVGYLRGLEAGEMRRGDGLIALAYHWLVVNGGPHDGTRVEVRPWNVQGGATLHHNETSRAVVLTGDFTNERVTPAALDSLGETWADGIRGGFVSTAAVIQPHSVYYPTACCGTHLVEQLPALRATVANKLRPQPVIPWDVIFEMAAWEKRLSAPEVRHNGKRVSGPIRYGDEGDDVELLGHLLHNRHLLRVVRRKFGRRMRDAVLHFKRIEGYRSDELDGNYVGGRMGALLLKP